ncbi:ATP-binding protein, partial [bacterium]|nr:ATP-binding protein [bacterium]
MGIALQRMTEILRNVSLAAEAVAEGDTSIQVVEQGSKDLLAQSFNRMTKTLSISKLTMGNQIWLSNSLSDLNEILRAALTEEKLADEVCSYFAKTLNAQMLAMYHLDKSGLLELQGSYAFSKRKSMNNTIEVGEGLIGQAAKEKKLISVSNLPGDYTRIGSALGDSLPKNLVEVPFVTVDNLIGVIELASFNEITDIQLDFLHSTMEPVAIAISMLKDRVEMKDLLEESQRQSEELQAQQYELKSSNESLMDQTQRLRVSEENLKAQQEELQASNEELEEKTEYLEKQKDQIDRKNTELEASRTDLEERAEELRISSKYKSEFLANMSHELRTPLNSLLLLARGLSNNREGNLSEKQIKSANTIYDGGNDLLKLINEILDLSKIEAGKMEVLIEEISIQEIISSMDKSFSHIAEDRGLDFDISVDSGLPLTFNTDLQKTNQITKNLLSNALKFTSEGFVKVSLSTINEMGQLMLRISVSDSGIGIPKDKQREIFEAFQQADGSTTRNYGGTGLGLSISRRLSELLGGKLKVESSVNKGSTFSLLLPLEDFDINNNIKFETKNLKANIRVKSLNNIVIETVSDDKNSINEKDRIILIIEDDPKFAEILVDYCRSFDFKAIHASSGEMGLDILNKVSVQGVL